MTKTKVCLLLALLVAGVCSAQSSIQAPAEGAGEVHPDTLFNQRATEMIRESDVTKKEALYREILQQFPEEASAFRKERYVHLRTSLALFWSSRGNAEKVLEYYRLTRDKQSPGMAVAFASNLVGHQYYREAISILDDVMEPITASANGNSIYTFLQAYDYYAQALFHLDRKTEALGYAQKAYDKSDKKNTQVNSTYAMILNSLGKHSEALPIMENLVRDGMATDRIKELFRDSYARHKGSDKGFDKLMASLEQELKKKMEHEADVKLVSEEAFAFSLRDMEGKTVSLADLKGKVVVLDFWATWCGPCVKSFPAMQMAVNKYKNDGDVKFLFIDTGEKIPDYEAVVRKFIADKKYSFHVLYDARDAQTQKYAVASGYKIRGIPTKLIIDRKGVVRYRLVGFSGGNDATVAELVAMIEKTRNF